MSRIESTCGMDKKQKMQKDIDKMNNERKQDDEIFTEPKVNDKKTILKVSYQ